MNKRNGFTIVELIITIGLIVLVGFMVTNSIIAVTKKNNKKDYDAFTSKLEKGACTFANLTKNMEECSGSCTVSVQDLIAEGLIGEDIKNPETNEALEPLSTIQVYHINGEKICVFNEDGDYDNIGPVITYNKSLLNVAMTFKDDSELKGYAVTDSNKRPLKFTKISGNTATANYIPMLVGEYYIHAIDEYENYSNKLLTITSNDIDQIPPTIDYYLHGGNIVLTFSDNFALSGYKVLKNKLPNNEVTDYTTLTGKTEVVAYQADASGYYYVYAIDQAGLITMKEIDFVIETSKIFNCTREEEIYIIPFDGNYTLDINGAKGGHCSYIRRAEIMPDMWDCGGIGGDYFNNYKIISTYNFIRNDELIIRVGCNGTGGSHSDSNCSSKGTGIGGWNGGKNGKGNGWSGSGGNTDVILKRFNKDTNSYEEISLLTAKGGNGCHVDDGGTTSNSNSTANFIYVASPLYVGPSSKTSNSSSLKNNGGYVKIKKIS